MPTNPTHKGDMRPIPCPFCGSADTHIYSGHGGKKVQCLACGASGVSLDVWNTRAQSVGLAGAASKVISLSDGPSCFGGNAEWHKAIEALRATRAQPDELTDDERSDALWGVNDMKLRADREADDSPAIPEVGDRVTITGEREAYGDGTVTAVEGNCVKVQWDDGDSHIWWSFAADISVLPTPASHTAPDALRALVERLGALLVKVDGPNGRDWIFPWRVQPCDGKPTIVSHKGGNLFRGYIGTWQEADLIVEVANALPDLLAALATPAPSRDEVGREALESALRALAIDSTPIIRRLARIQIKAALNKDTGDVQ